MTEARGHIPNLARRPFLNARPVIRVAMLLTALGLLLAAANLFAYWSFSQGQDVKQVRLEETRDRILQIQEELTGLEQRRQRIDLDSQNEQVQFLNRKIEQRTFGWSLLFDTLAELLPRDVRIGRLSLQSIEENDRSRRAAKKAGDELRPGEILLGIQGQARSFEAFVDFVDALFGSSAFRRVDPTGDSKIQTGMSQFTLSVIYLPERAAALDRAVSDAESRTVEDGGPRDGGLPDGGLRDGASPDGEPPDAGAREASSREGRS